MMSPFLSVVIPLADASDLAPIRSILTSWQDGFSRHGIDAELILVEWKARPGEGGLDDLVASLNQGNSRCRLRLLKIPAEVHDGLPHADKVSAFLHLAQNIGLRRSRGQWVLLSRADIFLSDEMFRFLGSGQLEKGRLYLGDRYDFEGSGEEARLAAIQTRRETIDLKADGIDVATLRVPSDKYIDSWGQFGLLALTFLAESRFVLRSAWAFLKAPSSLAFSARLGLAWKILSAEWRNIGLMFQESLGVQRERKRARLFFADYPTGQAGDFLLLDRESWFSLRGLPEWAGAPDHVAALFLLVALGSGRVRESYLRMPFGICKRLANLATPSQEDGSWRLSFLRAAGMAQAYIEAGPGQPYNGDAWGMAGLTGLELPQDG
ncbi:MAG: hypothetical protein HQL43_03935 [Alphaproteobacteria bacterium]|nr:hypothetical protein [Alphaproteobacteria bacterium]